MSAEGQRDPGEDHDSRVGAKSPCSDMKRAVAKKLIERYFYQLTDGCGNPDCDNQNCASSGKVTNLTPNQAAAQAIQLFSQEARLCDGTQPSKVARTTLEPGPASLAKSLPVKSVKPTCSDEGIAPNSNVTTPAPPITEVWPDMSNGANESCPAPRTLESNAKTAPQSKVSDIADVTEEQISTESNVPFPLRDSRSCQFFVRNRNRCSNDRTLSEGDILLKMFDKYRIRIPRYNNHDGDDNNSNNNKTVRRRKRNKIAAKPLKPKKKRKSRAPKRLASAKTVNAGCCSSRFVSKLLILNLYLRYLERERYAKYV